MRARGLLCLALLAGAAAAASGADYASQWPVALPSADAGLYRVHLAPEVYAAAQSPRLDDVDLVDAGGRPVSAQLFAAGAAPTEAATRRPVPWFALPQVEGTVAGDVALSVERAADGSVRRVDAQLGARSAAAAPAAWLVDASAIDGDIAALLLDWQRGPEPLEAAYRIEGSDDLRQWRVLQQRTVLLDLTRAGRRLRQHRLPVEAAARYLRLVPLSGAAGVALTRVEVEQVVPGPARTLPAQWRELPGRAAARADAPAWIYELDGRFPVESVDVALAGSGTGQWRLYSRERSDAPWVHRAGPWLGYRIGVDQRSPPQPLARIVRDRYWKLEGDAAQAQPPVLRLGWRPESLVFVAGESPPYRLVAGSARATRAAAPVAQSLQAIRDARGRDWQPPVASLGPEQALSGEAALRPARDWRSWLLWALLVSGALLVTGFALSLLRRPRP